MIFPGIFRKIFITFSHLYAEFLHLEQYSKSTFSLKISIFKISKIAIFRNLKSLKIEKTSLVDILNSTESHTLFDHIKNLHKNAIYSSVMQLELEH